MTLPGVNTRVRPDIITKTVLFVVTQMYVAVGQNLQDGAQQNRDFFNLCVSSWPRDRPISCTA